jgi:hypothetical protein
LDQIVAAIAGDREERDLITEVLFGHLHDAGAVRYRQEVFQDLEDPAVFDEVQRFADLMGEVRAYLRQMAKMQYRYHREGWLLDAAAIYCDAVQSLAGHLASAAICSYRSQFPSYQASAVITPGIWRRAKLGWPEEAPAGAPGSRTAVPADGLSGSRLTGRLRAAEGRHPPAGREYLRLLRRTTLRILGS